MSWTFKLEHCENSTAFNAACNRLCDLSGTEGSLVKKLPDGSVIVVTKTKDLKIPQSVTSLHDFCIAFLEKNSDYLTKPADFQILEKAWHSQPTLLQSLKDFLLLHPLVAPKGQEKEIQQVIDKIKDQWPEGTHFFVKNKGAIVKALILLYKHPPDPKSNLSKLVTYLSHVLSEAKQEDFLTTPIRDKEELFTLLDFASVKEVPGAEALKGHCYSLGIGVEPDLETAAFCFDDAALRLQEPMAQYHFGISLMHNSAPLSFEAMNRDVRIKEALLWLNAAAKNGNPFALKKLGLMYLKGEPLLDIKPDPKKGVEYFQKSAQLGHPTGQYQLAKCLSEGIGGPKNEQKARQMYEQAAWQGDPDAQYALALIYLTPGKEQRTDAIRLLMQAAEQGHEQALKSLENLLGPSKDVLQQAENVVDALNILYTPSKKWFSFPNIVDKILSYCSVFDKMDEKNFNKILEEKARLCAKNTLEASKKGWAGAMRALAETEWHGFHSKAFERNYSAAQEHFISAISAGDKIASNRLGICIVEQKSVTMTGTEKEISGQ